MRLTITPTMSLDQLAERMSPNGDDIPAPTVAAMRALLAEHAPAYGWKTTADVEDADWFRMLATATGEGQA